MQTAGDKTADISFKGDDCIFYGLYLYKEMLFHMKLINCSFSLKREGLDCWSLVD